MEAKKTEVTSGEILMDRVKLVWKIENYSMIWKSEEFRCRQQLYFQAGSSIGLASGWIAYFHEKEDTSKTPEGTETTKKVGELCVGLDSFSATLKELMAYLIVKIKAERDADDKAFRLDNLIDKSTQPASPLEWTVFGNAWDLPLINGCLVVELELTVIKPKDCTPLPQQSVQQIKARFQPRFTEKMQQDLAKLLEGSNMQSDATIVSKDDVKFAVHRCILSERSPVFETMFQTPITESQTGIVTIPDLSSKTVGVLLQFLYTGTLHQDWSDEQVLPELVYAANKYGLQDLIKFLDRAVGHVCTKESAGRLLSLMTKLGMKTGERKVDKFIKWHKLSFEDTERFEDESTQEPENVKSEKWNVLRILPSSWRMMLGSSLRKSPSQKTKSFI